MVDEVTRATWYLVWATWALVAVTFVLAVVGAVYAWFTLGILREQKRTSAAQVTPNLAPRLSRIEQHALADLVLSVRNYGHGAALGVDAVVRFEPGETLRYVVRTTGIASGEDHVVLLGNGDLPPLQRENLSRTYTHLRLVGTCMDVAQRQHRIDILVPLAEGTAFPAMEILREMLERQGVFRRPPQVWG